MPAVSTESSADEGGCDTTTVVLVHSPRATTLAAATTTRSPAAAGGSKRGERTGAYTGGFKLEFLQRHNVSLRQRFASLSHVNTSARGPPCLFLQPRSVAAGTALPPTHATFCSAAAHVHWTVRLRGTRLPRRAPKCAACAAPMLRWQLS